MSAPGVAQDRNKHASCCGAEAKAPKKSEDRLEESSARFGARVENALGGEQTAKGEWGVLVVDAKTGQTLFEQNSDRYFVPASNMKLLTTAIALATLWPDYRFRTTLESQMHVTTVCRLNVHLY